ncbi:MAG: HIT family protein [Patescibacteria group bacterium]
MCIFCKIINKEIPNYTVYEDDFVLAFLDINPCTKGHTLVIPKKHYENVFVLPDEELQRITVVAKKIAILLKEKLGAEGINFLNSNGKIAQQEIEHYHMHIIPRYKDNNCKIDFLNKTEEKDFESVIAKINK